MYKKMLDISSNLCKYFLDKFIFILLSVQSEKLIVSRLLYLIAVWHLKLSVDYSTLSLSVCIVMKVVLHQFKSRSPSFSVRTVL